MDERYSYHDLQVERWETLRREQEADMSETLTTGKVISKGSLVAVEVMGIPGKTGSDAVWTYEAHDDVEIGEMVMVPAPGWTIPVTSRTELPGYVLGLASSGPVDRNKLRPTLPVHGAAPPAPDTSALIAQVTSYRAQALAFRAAADGVDAAADAIEAALAR